MGSAPSWRSLSGPDGAWAGGRLAPVKLVDDGAPVPDPVRRGGRPRPRVVSAGHRARAPRLTEDGEILPPA